MSAANPLWGAPRIHGELLKLGVAVSQASVAKYMVRRDKRPSQSWRTFLANHLQQLAAAEKELADERFDRERAEKDQADWIVRASTAADARRAAEQRAEQLRAAWSSFKPYHSRTCRRFTQGPCDCGLTEWQRRVDAALAATGEGKADG